MSERICIIVATGLGIALTLLFAVLTSLGANLVEHVVVVLLVLVGVLALAFRGSKEPSAAGETAPGDSSKRVRERAERPIADERSSDGIKGAWSGTARVRPADPDEVLRLYPVRVAIQTDPVRVRLLAGPETDEQSRISAIDVLEDDADAGRLGVRVTVRENGREETHVARLARRRGLLTNEGDRTTLSLDLKRPDAPVHHARPV